MINNKPRALIFGCGHFGKSILDKVKEEYNVIGYLDTYETGDYNGIKLYSPTKINDFDYEIIIVATMMSMNTVLEQLQNIGVQREKINTDYVVVQTKARILFMEKLGNLFYDRKIEGCVAEGGVFEGDFAKEINRVFSNRKLYLFDTFKGFDASDVVKDIENDYSDSKINHLCANEKIVMSKLKYPEMCTIRKGHFPNTANGINEEFCFVNLDFDLYQPTFSGLEYFYPRMVSGGVILIHDYFSEKYKGVKKAVNDWMKKMSFQIVHFWYLSETELV